MNSSVVSSATSVAGHSAQDHLRRYEMFLVFPQKMSLEQIKKITQQHTALADKCKGSQYTSEYCGLRDAPHTIKGYKKVHFYMVNMCTSPEIQKEMHQKINIDEQVLRFYSLRIVDKEAPIATRLVYRPQSSSSMLPSSSSSYHTSAPTNHSVRSEHTF